MMAGVAIPAPKKNRFFKVGNLKENFEKSQVQGYSGLGFFTVDLGFQNLRPPTDRGKQKTK